MHEGAPDSDVFLILRGRVKVVSYGTNGHPVLLAVRIEGDVVGELAALDGRPRSATVVAAARTTGQSVRRDTFLAALDADPGLNAALRSFVTGKLRDATRSRVDHGFPSALIRLVRALEQMGRNDGRPRPQGVLLDIALTQAELAAMVGVSEATIQRCLAELRQRGLIRSGYRQLLLCDVDGLAALSEEP